MLIPKVVISVGYSVMVVEVSSKHSLWTQRAMNCVFFGDWVLMIGMACPCVHLAHLTIVASKTQWISLGHLMAPDMLEKFLKSLKFAIALKALWLWNLVLINRDNIRKVEVIIVLEAFPVPPSMIILRKKLWKLVSFTSRLVIENAKRKKMSGWHHQWIWAPWQSLIMGKCVLTSG